MNILVNKIKAAKTIILTTHRQCDGDGLGAELGMYHALKAAGKNVKIINVDATPKKYRFLEPDRYIQYYEQDPTLPESVDLTLVFDTNDERMLTPLYKPLRERSEVLAFIDHHPILKKGPQPSRDSLIDISAASTGEISFRLIKALGLPINREVARAIYTSIAFDTQLYRFVRNSPQSHLIAAELLNFDIDSDEVHRYLFGNQTVQKLAFLAKALGQIEYYCDGRLAVLRLKDADLFHYNLEPDESRDVIDMLMNIETLEAAALFREDGENEYKLSLRSKGHIEVIGVAENFSGGGHAMAAGAYVKGDFETIKNQVVEQLTNLLENEKMTGT